MSGTITPFKDQIPMEVSFPFIFQIQYFANCVKFPMEDLLASMTGRPGEWPGRSA